MGNFEGILQSDGYGAYDRVGGPGIVHAGCWAHARRKFFDTVKLNPKGQTTIEIVAQMGQLFAIDAEARAQKLTQSDRHLLRDQKARPLLEQIKAAIEAARVRLWKGFHNRKNWIHIGSKEAGPRVAAIVSIVETCRRLNISIRDHLGSVLPGLADRPISQTTELTPAASANRNAPAPPPTSSTA